MDRAYTDFRRLSTFTQNSAFFIVRAKSNLDCIRRSSRPVEKSTDVRSDQTVILVGPKTSTLYSDPLRRISYFDSENQKRVERSQISCGWSLTAGILEFFFSIPPESAEVLPNGNWIIVKKLFLH
jgi:hypothetical protein